MHVRTPNLLSSEAMRAPTPLTHVRTPSLLKYEAMRAPTPLMHVHIPSPANSEVLIMPETLACCRSTIMPFLPAPVSSSSLSMSSLAGAACSSVTRVEACSVVHQGCVCVSVLVCVCLCAHLHVITCQT